MLLGVAGLLIYGYAGMQSRHVRAGVGQRITLTYNNHTAPEAQQPILLGTSAAWVFVYWPQQRTAEAIPQSGVAHIGYAATR